MMQQAIPDNAGVLYPSLHKALASAHDRPATPQPTRDPRHGWRRDNRHRGRSPMTDEMEACLVCGTGGVPVAYGYLTPQTFLAAERGEVVLGGCCIAFGGPTLACPRCGTWFSPRPPHSNRATSEPENEGELFDRG